MRSLATLGPTLRRHRGVRTAEAVAEAAGISVDTLAAIETSRHLPPVPVVRAIVKALELGLPPAPRFRPRSWRPRTPPGRTRTSHNASARPERWRSGRPARTGTTRPR